jgi:hypothetical protein
MGEKKYSFPTALGSCHNRQSLRLWPSAALTNGASQSCVELNKWPVAISFDGFYLSCRKQEFFFPEKSKQQKTNKHTQTGA